MNIVAIGLEADVVAEIEKQTGHKILSFPTPPKIYAKEGKAYVLHPHVMYHYFAPDFVLWYGYFEDPTEPMRNATLRASRLALALSNTPTFPDVRTTLPWDDKMLSVVLALTVDEVSPPRGLFPPHIPVQSTPNTVLKWGNGHCGDGKQLLVTGQEESQACVGDVLTEPFVEGRSYRILIVDNYLCQLEYVSADWRKNVQGTIQVCETVDYGMALRAQELTSHYCLSVAGIDFVRPGENEPAMLLEVNAYPSLEQDPRSKAVFCRLALIESGKPRMRFALRLSNDLHVRAQRLAELDGVSLNQYLNIALAQHIVRQESPCPSCSTISTTPSAASPTSLAIPSKSTVASGKRQSTPSKQ